MSGFIGGRRAVSAVWPQDQCVLRRENKLAFLLPQTKHAGANKNKLVSCDTPLRMRASSGGYKESSIGSAQSSSRADSYLIRTTFRFGGHGKSRNRSAFLRCSLVVNLPDLQYKIGLWRLVGQPYRAIGSRFKVAFGRNGSS